MSGFIRAHRKMRRAYPISGRLALIVILTAVAMATAAAIPAQAAARMPVPGAASCSGCHASAGSGSAIPSLAGWTEDGLAAALIAFREGKRPATVMDRIAKGFSDEEIQAIAKWLAAEEKPRKDAKP